MSINAPNFPNAVWDGTSPERPNARVVRRPGPEDWDQIVAEVVATQDFIDLMDEAEVTARVGDLENIADDLAEGVIEAESYVAFGNRLFSNFGGAAAVVGTALTWGEGEVVLADDDSDVGTATVMGLSLSEAGEDDPVEIATNGVQIYKVDWTNVTGEPNLVPGPYYLGADGALTNVPTDTPTEFVTKVGLALDMRTMLVEIEEPQEVPA